MEKSKFVKINGIFIYYCALCASLTKELELPYSKIFERFTILWSILIFITSVGKFFYIHELTRSILSFSDIVFLNYLPTLNEYGKLYHGLMSVCVGTPLAWRLYLTWYKPLRSYAATSSNRDAAAKLILFFIDGPQSQKSPPKPQSPQLIFGSMEYLLLNGHSNQRPLSQAHESLKTVAFFDGQIRPDMLYKNAMRALPLKDDLSQERWLFLSRYVYSFVLLVVILATPIIYYTIVGLYLVLENFAEPGPLYVYGILEMTYVSAQSAMLFIFTNVFITLFYADLAYKMNNVTRSVHKLGELCIYSEEPVEFDRAQIYQYQLRLWQFFDHMSQFDRLVSKYGKISILTFIIGLSFGQSCYRIGEPALKAASAAILASNVISFTYLYLISTNLEQKSARVYITICSIIARDTDYATKKAWQRLRIGFYRRDRIRTFSMDDQYPLNLYYYFRIVLGLAAMSLVISKQYHKRVWDDGFKKKISL